jgi:hypothetical protein
MGLQFCCSIPSPIEDSNTSSSSLSENSLIEPLCENYECYDVTSPPRNLAQASPQRVANQRLLILSPHCLGLLFCLWSNGVVVSPPCWQVVHQRSSSHCRVAECPLSSPILLTNRLQGQLHDANHQLQLRTEELASLHSMTLTAVNGIDSRHSANNAFVVTSNLLSNLM